MREKGLKLDEALLDGGQHRKTLDWDLQLLPGGIGHALLEICQSLSIHRSGGCRAAAAHGIPVGSQMLANLLARQCIHK